MAGTSAFHENIGGVGAGNAPPDWWGKSLTYQCASWRGNGYRVISLLRIAARSPRIVASDGDHVEAES